jgi:hypothetical protein
VLIKTKKMKRRLGRGCSRISRILDAGYWILDLQIEEDITGLSIQYLVSGIQHPASSIQYLASSIPGHKENNK